MSIINDYKDLPIATKCPECQTTRPGDEHVEKLTAYRVCWTVCSTACQLAWNKRWEGKFHCIRSQVKKKQ